MIDRCVVDVLNAMPERNRYIRGLRAWIGFKQTAVKFERDPRFAGDVKYTFSKSFAVAMTCPLVLCTFNRQCPFMRLSNIFC